MNQAQKNEYDFFMRCADMFEARIIELSKLRQSKAIKAIIEQAEADLKNAKLWAQRIEAGVKFTLPEK